MIGIKYYIICQYNVVLRTADRFWRCADRMLTVFRLSLVDLKVYCTVNVSFKKLYN